MSPFSILKTGQDLLERIQQNIANALNPLLAIPLVDGNLISQYVLKAGSVNLVPHGLGRKPKLWFVAGQNGNNTVWETPSLTTTQFLALNTTPSTQTVNLWVA